MKIKLFHFLSKGLFVIGLSILFFLAFHGAKGIIFSVLSLWIGVFAIVFLMKYEDKTGNDHAPLLFDVLMIAALIAAFFSKEIPGRVYPVLICWLLCFILNIVFWLVDKQYEGKNAKQVISSNLRLPLIVDFIIIIINVHDLITDERDVNIVLACLLIALALIDLCRQLIMAKKGKIEIKNLF